MKLSLIKNIQVNDINFYDISITYISLSILVIAVIIVIILLADKAIDLTKMKIDFLLDNEPQRPKRNRTPIDLVYTPIWDGRFCFRDRNDPTGSKLALLLTGKHYTTLLENNTKGYLLSSFPNGMVYGLDGNIEARFPVLPQGVALVEGRQIAILSGMTPAVREHGFMTGTITFLVKRQP